MQKAIMEPFVRLIKPKHLAIFTRRACPHCEKAMNLLDKIEAPYHEHEVSKFKQDEMSHLDEISGTRTVPKVFIGMKCIGGNEELQQSWKKKVLYDWLRKEQISYKESSETIDAAAGKDASGKEGQVKDKKPADGAKKKKNKEDTTTTSSADDAGHKDTSKKKNDSQVDKQKKEEKPKKEKEEKPKKEEKKPEKKTNASQLGNKGDNVGGIESDHKGASGTQDEGPLSHLGVKHFESPDSGHRNTKEQAQTGAKTSASLGASGKLDGRLGTRQTDQPKKGLGLDTGRDNFEAGSTVKDAPLSTQKGGSGTYNPAEKRDDSHVDHPLGLKKGALPEDQTSSVGDKHPNKVGTHKGDQNQRTNQTGKDGVNRKVVGNHGVDIGKGQSQDHRVNHDVAREKEREREAQ